MAEPVLLLDLVPRVTADLALDLLRGAGIPALLRGPDFDVAELGAVAHDTVRGVGVYVPEEALEAACRVLDESWGRGWRAKEAGPIVRSRPDAP